MEMGLVLRREVSGARPIAAFVPKGHNFGVDDVGGVPMLRPASRMGRHLRTSSGLTQASCHEEGKGWGLGGCREELVDGDEGA